MRPSRPVIAAGACGAALLGMVVGPLAASATDTRLGEIRSPDASCFSPSTFVQTRSAAPSFTAPGVGVITAYAVTGDKSIASKRGFKVARPATSGLQIIASTTPVIVAAGSTLTQPARIPVRPGDVLGMYIGTDSHCAVTVGGTSDGYSQGSGDLAVGSSITASSLNGYRLTVSATYEPDVDGDGFGDTTQDHCPTSAATQNPCIGPLGRPTGKAKVGKKLTAAPVVVPSGVTASYQWIRVVKKAHKTVLTPIGGATGSSYNVRGKDRGKKLLVRVTLSAPGYASATADSPTRKAR